MHFGITRAAGCMHNDTMTEDREVALSIRHVGIDVRDRLVARARARGQSLQEYLLGLVNEHVAHPSREEVIARIAAFRATLTSHIAHEDVLHAIDNERKERDEQIWDATTSSSQEPTR